VQTFPVMRYSDRDKCMVVTLYNAETKQREYKHVNEKLVLDFGVAKHGQERFLRGFKYDLIEAPISEPLPDAPDDNYKPVGLMHVVVPSIGMTQLIVDYDPLADLLSNVYERYVAAKESTEDRIPLVEFNAADMGMEIVDWIARDTKYFGKRKVPMPGLRKEHMHGMSPLNGQSHATA
jgi:hypothetical protein